MHHNLCFCFKRCVNAVVNTCQFDRCIHHRLSEYKVLHTVNQSHKWCHFMVQEEHVFSFTTNAKIVVLCAALLTSYFLGLQISGYLSPLTYSDKNNSIDFRYLYIMHGDYFRLSVGANSDEWLLLMVSSNVSTYIYVRGATSGDLKVYNAFNLVTECSSWFIVTVRPSANSEIHIEWITYNQSIEAFESALFSNNGQTEYLLPLVVATNLVALFVVFRSRYTIIE